MHYIYKQIMYNDLLLLTVIIGLNVNYVIGGNHTLAPIKKHLQLTNVGSASSLQTLILYNDNESKNVRETNPLETQTQLHSNVGTPNTLDEKRIFPEFRRGVGGCNDLELEIIEEIMDRGRKKRERKSLIDRMYSLVCCCSGCKSNKEHSDTYPIDCFLSTYCRD
eukprot:283449_1